MADLVSGARPAEPPLGGARAWLVLTPAALIYVLAVAARTSFAVAVPQAGERFPGGASLLATFVVLQLAVYASAQLPVGLLLDRFGSRRVLVAGALVVACGQLLMAAATSVPAAVLARVLVGAGDATAFIGVLRLLPAWFPLGTVPLMSQLVSAVGQLGQVVSAVPFLALLHSRGWSTTFATMSGTALAIAVVGLALVRDTPPGTASVPVRRRESMRVMTAQVLRHPGTWLGFFCHWVGMFPAAMLTLMWGVAWMTQGLGVTASTASAVLTANTVAGIVGGLSAGMLSSRFPAGRSTIVMASALVSVAAWCLGVLLPHPVAAAFLAAVVLGVTAPYSGIGFDVARSLNAPARWGTCTGLVNTGGFSATILAVQLVGVVLDRCGAGRTAGDFRLAVASTSVVWLVGMVGLLVSRRATRRRLREGSWQASF